jgi:hypothetical protein
MTRSNHPYAALENHPAWKVLDRAIKKLVANGDLDEQTTREHIVGYILNELTHAAVLDPQIIRPIPKRVKIKRTAAKRTIAAAS